MPTFANSQSQNHMSNIRITKRFNFEMAHALHGYDGKCAQIHGHSYELAVTIIGTPILDSTDPKLGMVMDFGDLKKIVNEKVVSELDHAVLLSKDSGKVSSDTAALLERVVYVDFQPTCENLLLDMVSKIKPDLPENLTLHSLKLVETPTSFAEWFASGN